ncbi:MAG: hypothetical protein LVR00_03425 [Rhabdochlamydiaceae bacterium]|jgi:hypothetical protein
MNFNNYPTYKAWEKIGKRPRNGINLPLFPYIAKIAVALENSLISFPSSIGVRK